MGETWICGDIHGGYKALEQCLDRSNFDKRKDKLIQLGDVCDGWNEVYECVETLLSLSNLIAIKGNHDNWFLTWIETGIHEWRQGAFATLQSYGFNCLGREWEKFQVKFNTETGTVETNLNPGDIPERHKWFFRHQLDYYIDKGNLFIHAGFNRDFDIKDQMPHIYYWDRDLWNLALSFESMMDKSHKFKMKSEFKEIFIGHTSTTNWADVEERSGGIIVKMSRPRTTPMHAVNIWNIDTGGGWKGGKLTFMNLNTKEIIQSDLLKSLYTDQNGR